MAVWQNRRVFTTIFEHYCTMYPNFLLAVATESKIEVIMRMCGRFGVCCVFATIG